MNKNIFLIVALVILTMQATAYTIEGDSVILEDQFALLKVTPHTAQSPVGKFEQEFTLCNKTDIGRMIYSAYVFEEPLESGKIEYWQKPYYEYVEHELNCPSDFNYVLNEDTDQNPHRAWCFNADINGTGVDEILWEQEFKTGNPETATIYFDVNQLTMGNEWINATNIYQNNHQILNGKNIYPNIQGTVFLPNTCKTWRIEYTPSETDTTEKWDLWLWTNVMGWSCILTDSCQRTLKLDPWWIDGDDWLKKRLNNLPAKTIDIDTTIVFRWDSSEFAEAKSDLSDIRQIDESDDTVIPRDCDGLTTEGLCFYILNKTVESGNTDYYTYYDNDSASAPTEYFLDSNVFGFEHANYTFSTFAGVRSTDEARYGTYSYKTNNVGYKLGVTTLDVMTDAQTADFNYGVWGKVATNLTNGYNQNMQLLAGGTSVCRLGFLGQAGHTHFGYAGGENTGVNITLDTWYYFEIHYENSSATCYYTIVDETGTEMFSKPFAAEAQSDITKVVIYNDGAGGNSYWDNFYYGAPTEVTSLGPEEEPVTDSCTCPASGHWEITNSDICTLADECNLSGGGLHLVNGSLTITSTGTLKVPTNETIVMQNSPDVNFTLENGATLIIEK